MSANIVSVSLFPCYKMTGKHMEPVVVEAVRRVLFDNMTVTTETISAAHYEAATGCERANLCDVLDRHRGSGREG